MSTPELETWPELLAAVESNQGVAQIRMATLRGLEGRERSGKHIRAAIEEKLKNMGLGHLPEELPNRQQKMVTLYRFGTPASEVIQGVQRAREEPLDATTFDYLHRLNTTPEPGSMVEREEMSEALASTARGVLDLLAQVQRPSNGSGEETTTEKTTEPSASELTEMIKSLGSVSVSRGH